NQQRIWLVDGAGGLEDIGLQVSGYAWFSPTGDGRIYCTDSQTQNQLAWIDAANRVHLLLNDAGTGPYQFSAGPLSSMRGMRYEPGTNALYMCSTLDCSGVSNLKINVGKLPLSADGTRTAGPLTCASYDVTPAFLEAATGMSLAPDGKILVFVNSPDGV